MSARITSGQIKQAQKLVGDTLTSLDPGKDAFQEGVLKSPYFQPRFRELVVALMARYFIPLTDEEALVWLMEQAKKPKPDAKRLVEGCRKGAIEQGEGSDPCHWAVELGATLKQTIPTLGPCVEDFNYMQDWQLKDDMPTECSMVSGVTVALREAASQNLATQLQTLRMVEERWGVPQGFFSRELIPTVYTAGVALTHFNMKKRDMFGDLWVRTGTCYAGGVRLRLYWDQGRLNCDGWGWVDRGHPDLAVAPLGVTKALGR